MPATQTTKTTVAALFAGGLPQGGQHAYLKTWTGTQQITGLRNFGGALWVVCGKMNAGFGMSFAVTPQTPV